MSPTPTIQVTSIEFVTGKPKGRAISTAPCGNPCSSPAEAACAVAVAQTTAIHMTALTIGRLSCDDIGQPHHEVAVIVGHDRITFAQPDLSRWHELAVAGS